MKVASTKLIIRAGWSIFPLLVGLLEEPVEFWELEAMPVAFIFWDALDAVFELPEPRVVGFEVTALDEPWADESLLLAEEDPWADESLLLEAEEPWADESLLVAAEEPWDVPLVDTLKGWDWAKMAPLLPEIKFTV